MNFERFIGFIFLVVIVLSLGFIIEPQEEYRSIQIQKSETPILITEEETQKEIILVEEDSLPIDELEINKNEALYNSDVASNTSEIEFFDESDFDLYVLRVHVLSSLENAENLSRKIKRGGYPSFVEEFGKNKDLYAIYVGPFLSKDEISSNIEDIKEVSQSNQGEVTRWKL